MKTEFTLRVVLSETLHANLSAYAKRTGLSLSNVTRCFLVVGLDGEDGEAELAALVVKLTAKLEKVRESKRPDPAGGGSGE